MLPVLSVCNQVILETRGRLFLPVDQTLIERNTVFLDPLQSKAPQFCF